MDFPSAAERIRDLIMHYRLLSMQHGALSDDGQLLHSMCVCERESVCMFNVKQHFHILYVQQIKDLKGRLTPNSKGREYWL